MTTYSPILGIPQVAPNQAQKETTINDGISIIERSLNDVKTLDVSSASVVLTAADYTRSMLLKVSGATAPGKTVTVPATKRFFMAQNTGSSAFTVIPQGTGGATVSIPAGSTVILFNTGVDIVKIADSAAATNVGTILGLTDAPSDYSGQAGKTLVVNGTEDGMVFGAIAVSFAQLTDGFTISTQGGKSIRVKADGSGLESYTPAAPGSATFLGLTDTPSTFAGKGLKVATVKADESGLDFLDLPDPIVKATRNVPLVNGDFESGTLSGWTVDSGFNWSVSAGYSGITPNGGTKFLLSSGADTSLQSLSQVVDLTTIADADKLDDSAEFALKPKTQTLGSVADTCTFEIQPLDASDIAIGSAFVFGPYNNSGGWVERSLRGNLPTGTRHLSVRIKATDVDGSGVVFAFDEIVLEIKVSSDFVTEFSNLADVTAYAGNAGRVVIVNDTEDGLEYADMPSNLLGIKTVTGTSYTFILSDAGKYLRFTNAAAITATVPPSILSAGMQVMVRQAGAGKITFVAGSGVTLNSPETLKTLKTQSLVRIVAIDGSNFDLSGDLQSTTNYDLSFFVGGVMTASETVMSLVANHAFTILAGATGCYAKAGTASTSNSSLTLKKNGTSFGTIAFNITATGVFTIASDTSFAIGDVLSVSGPATADATLADIAVALAALR